MFMMNCKKMYLYMKHLNVGMNYLFLIFEDFLSKLNKY